MSRVLRPARHIIGHFGDESFQAITCTGTDNSKQTRENTPKTQQVTLSTISIYNKQTQENTKHTKTPSL